MLVNLRLSPIQLKKTRIVISRRCHITAICFLMQKPEIPQGIAPDKTVCTEYQYFHKGDFSTALSRNIFREIGDSSALAWSDLEDKL